MTENVDLKWRVIALACAVVGMGAASVGDSAVGVVIGAALMLLFGLWVRRKGRTEPTDWKTAYGVSGALIGLGLLLILGWNFGLGPKGVGFLGLAVAYLGVARIVTYWRSLEKPWKWRGHAVLLGCAAVFVIGFPLLLRARPGLLVAAVVASVLIAPLGLNLLSEDLVRRPCDAASTRRLVWIGGAGVIGGSAVIFSALPFKFAALAVLVIALFAFSVAANVAADVFIAVAAIMLGATFLPRSVEMDEYVQPRSGDRVLVTFGDSYTSGEGAKEFFRGTNTRGENECRRADTGYSPVVARMDGNGIDSVVFLACSGALATHLDTTAQYPDEPIGRPPVLGRRGLPQIQHYNWVRSGSFEDFDVQLVIVAVGGNDAGFGDIGRTCIGPGNCVEYGQRWLDRLPPLYDDLGRVFDRIDRMFPEVKVLVVPYPIPLNESKRNCDYTTLQEDEHKFLAEFTGELNNVLEAAAAKARFHVLADARTALEERGLRICDGEQAKDAGINFVSRSAVDGAFEQTANPTNWLHNSLHPNDKGHEAIAEELDEWIRKSKGIAPRNGDRSDVPPAVKTLESFGFPPDFDHCNAPGTDMYCGDDPYDWLIDRTGRKLARTTPPLAALVIGMWLLSIVAIRRFGAPRD